jgi:predicted DNA-binding ribbon-helix-helix protein
MQHEATTTRLSSTSRVSRGRSSTAPAKEELIQTSFRLPRSRWSRLHELAIERRQTVQSVLVAALEAEFAREGRSF